jgi:hypothetical protein
MIILYFIEGITLSLTDGPSTVALPPMPFGKSTAAYSRPVQAVVLYPFIHFLQR